MPNVQISTGISEASLVDPGFDYGDYDKMTFDSGIFWRTWADNSNSTGNNPDGTRSLDIYTAAVALSVPEPSTWLLFGSGLAVLGGVVLRKNRKRQ